MTVSAPVAGVDHVAAVHFAVLHRHRPPAVVAGERGGAHRGADHAPLAHLDRAEVRQAILGERLEIDAPRGGTGDEEDVPPIVRRVERPLGEVVPVGELHEPARLELFGEELRGAGPVRDEHESPHRAVPRRDEEERMVVDRRMARHLPDARAGRLVAQPARLGRRDLPLRAHAARSFARRRGRTSRAQPISAAKPAHPPHHHGCPVGAKMMASATAQNANRSSQPIGDFT